MNAEEFYNLLENITSLNSWDLFEQIKPLEDDFCDEFQEIIKNEKKILAFSLKNGDLSPKISNTDISGKKLEYPDVNLFNEKELEYIKNRLTTTNNIFLKSRYAHILWSVTKNNHYAVSALKSYFSIIEFLIHNPEIDQFRHLVNFIECLLLICKKTKQFIPELKAKIIEIINSDQIPFYIKQYAIKVSFESKLFKNSELEFTLLIYESFIDLKDAGRYFNNKDLLELIIKIAKSLKKPTNIYFNKLAENHELLIIEHPDEKDFLRITLFGEQAQYYKSAENNVQYEKTLNEYTRLKSKYELQHFQIELPEKESKDLNDYLNFKASIILKMSPMEILNFLATDIRLLISNDELDSRAEKSFMNSFYRFFSVINFDINSNLKKLTDTQLKENERFKQFIIHFNICVLALLMKIMFKGIISGKLNYITVFQYLKDNSWFGQKFDRGIAEKEIDKNSNWLSLLSPGLFDYFSLNEWSVMMLNGSVPNYILSIDSLTLKFEGALRDLIRLFGGTTTIEKRGILQEGSLDDFLINPVIIKHFSGQDITLFKYVFTNSGWNLRNNVAHCFYPYSNYSFEKATLVFFCILRLSKYKYFPTGNHQS